MMDVDEAEKPSKHWKHVHQNIGNNKRQSTINAAHTIERYGKQNRWMIEEKQKHSTQNPKHTDNHTEE